MAGKRGDRQPDISRLPELGAGEAVRGNADDSEGPAIDDEWLSQHVLRAAEALAPEPIPENRGRLGAGAVIGGLQQTAGGGKRTERREVQSRYEVAAESLRLTAASQAERSRAKCEQARKGRRAIPAR